MVAETNDLISSQREHIEYNLLAQLTLPENERDGKQVKYLMRELYLLVAQELLDNLKSLMINAKLETRPFEIAKLIESLANLSREQGLDTIVASCINLQKQITEFMKNEWSQVKYDEWVTALNQLIESIPKQELK